MAIMKHRDKALADLLNADAAVTDSELQRIRSVRIARANGATWGDIGNALGVTRQAAHDRFAKAVTTVI